MCGWKCSSTSCAPIGSLGKPSRGSSWCLGVIFVVVSLMACLQPASTLQPELRAGLLIKLISACPRLQGSGDGGGRGQCAGVFPGSQNMRVLLPGRSAAAPALELLSSCDHPANVTIEVRGLSCASLLLLMGRAVRTFLLLLQTGKLSPSWRVQGKQALVHPELIAHTGLASCMCR
jgi:hypothetical protein